MASVKTEEGQEALVQVKLWDPWIRIFHWALAVTVIGALLTKEGPVELHYGFGLVTLGLVIFRLIWGVIGPHTARFSRFVKGPRAALAYLRSMGRRRPSYSFGHNPAGGALVAALLLLLLLQCLTGLVNTDDITFDGPLRRFAPGWLAGWLVRWHEGPGNLIMVLAILHVVAVIFYLLWKRENLIRAMLSGQAKLPARIVGATQRRGEAAMTSPLRAIFAIAAAAAVPLAIHFLL